MPLLLSVTRTPFWALACSKLQRVGRRHAKDCLCAFAVGVVSNGAHRSRFDAYRWKILRRGVIDKERETAALAETSRIESYPQLRSHSFS